MFEFEKFLNIIISGKADLTEVMEQVLKCKNITAWEKKELLELIANKMK